MEWYKTKESLQEGTYQGIVQKIEPLQEGMYSGKGIKTKEPYRINDKALVINMAATYSPA